MKYLKTIGSLGILSPLIFIILSIGLFVSSLDVNQSQSEMFRESFKFVISFYYLSILVFCLFLFGVIIHGFVAYKNRKQCV